MNASTPRIDLDAYFARIDYRGERTATLSVLSAVHEAHARSIPFENLASLSGAPVPLDMAAIQRKLVSERRGGYCFEHNTLLMAVLRALGFRVQGLAARVCWKLPADAPPAPRTHMLLQVTVGDEAWLADVGFGGLTQTAPLRFVPNLEQSTPHEPFRIKQCDPGSYLIEAKLGDVWHPLYQFDTQPQAAIDYELANWYVSAHPASRFVNHLIAALPAADGRHTLFDNRYSRHYLRAPSEHRVFTDAEELAECLRHTFAIALPSDSKIRKRLVELAARP